MLVSSRRAATACAIALAAAVVPAAVALPAAASPARHAAPSRPAAMLRSAYMLPPLGAEVPSSMLAINSKLEYKGKTYTLDFRGGIKQRVDVNPDEPFNSVRLRTVGFRVSAEHDSLGYVTFEQNDVDVEARSMLRVTQQFPPKYEERDELSLIAVMDKSGQPPVILVTKEPMILVASLSQYPAKGDTYRLERPVELMDPETGKVVAKLTEFNARRGGL